MSEIVAGADLLATYSSFTAAQAMAQGKPVVVIDWLRLPSRPEYFNLSLVRRSAKVKDLKQALIEGLNNSNQLSDDFTDGFNRHFSAYGSSADKMVKQISAAYQLRLSAIDK